MEYSFDPNDISSVNFRTMQEFSNENLSFISQKINNLIELQLADMKETLMVKEKIITVN